MRGQSVDWDYQWGQIVARAWADENFKQRLLTDAAEILQEYDLTPTGFRIEVLEDPERVPEDADGVMHLVLPGKPSVDELSEDDLCSAGALDVARCGSGGCHGCGGCGGCGGCVWCYHSPRPDEN